MCGTPNYISPEIATRASHGLETDVWGLGVMLYTILVGKPPFDTDDGIKSTLTLVVMSEIEVPSHLSTEVRDLMGSLLKKNPKDRIKLSKILEHPFMTRYSYAFSSSSRWGSHDSGVASSSCLTSKSYSYSNTNSVAPSSNNIFSLRPDYTASSWSKPGSRQPSYSEVPSMQHPISSVASINPSGISNSCCSMSSGHNMVCPAAALNGPTPWRHTETPMTAPRCPQPMSSGGLPVSDSSSHRYLSNSHGLSGAYGETNCSHAWKQCSQQCTHMDTCGCFRGRNVCTKGCSSICTHSSVNMSSCLSAQQSDAVKPLPHSIPMQVDQQDRPDVEIIRSLRPDLTIRPLSTKRLEPIRQKTKQVILNVLDTGEVCLEFIKIKHKTEKVVEVFRISSDGLRVCVLIFVAILLHNLFANFINVIYLCLFFTKFYL